MENRAGAVALIQQQLEGNTHLKKSKAGRHHYGVAELRQLLDYIYGPPATDAEKIKPYYQAD